MRPWFALLTLTCFVGCTGIDYLGTPLITDGREAGSPPLTLDAGSSGNTCAPAQQPMDPATLPVCCDGVGAAHCVASDKLSPALGAQLSACPAGGFCVPDPLISSGGAAPPSCKSLNDADGVCLSLCVPMVAQYRDLLPQATCAADERCAPCVNPLTNMSSGACDIGKPQDCSQPGDPTPPATADGGASTQAVCPHVGPPVLDPNSLPSCYAGGGAHCIAAALVPPAMASQLAACATGLCAPDVAIAAGGQFIPKTCGSLDGAEGRCLHAAIPQVASQLSMLTQDTCESYERCVPCYSPIDGKPTGACAQSCDPGPVKPAVTFAACCENNQVSEGKCVPTTVIPATLQKNLGTDSCVKNIELCVPAENLDPAFKPMACSASNLLTGNYTGVCLSEFLQFWLQSLGISRGNCDSQHRCVPCTQGGKPTGAPGCPPSP